MWQTVAQAQTFPELRSLIGEMELPKGTRMRVVMDAPGYDWVFDLPGAEWVFRPLVPPGMGMVDVWGESGKGYIEMEADPAWLVTTLLFIKTHWLSILIAGLLLIMIVTFIRVLVWTVQAPVGVPIALVLIGAAILLMPLIAGQVTKTRRELRAT